MTLTDYDLAELLNALLAGGDIDIIRRSMELVLQALIGAEVTEVIGAGPHERSSTRTTQRNGRRARLLSTQGRHPAVATCVPEGRHFQRAGHWPRASSVYCEEIAVERSRLDISA